MPTPVHVRACLVALALALALALRAHVISAAPARALVVLVAEPGRAKLGDLRVEALREQLSELPVELTIAAPHPSHDPDQQARRAAELARTHAASGVIWFATEAPDKLRVYVYEAQSKRFGSRQLVGANASPAAAEELAVVLRALVEALASGQAPAIERVEAPPEPIAPAPHRKLSTRSAAWVLGAGWISTTLGPTSGFDHGVAVLGAWRTPLGLYAGLHYSFIHDAELRAPGARAVLARHPLELVLGYAWPALGAHVGLELGTQLDVVERTTLVTAPELVPLPAETRVRWALSPRMRLMSPRVARLRIYFLGGVDVTLSAFDYVIESAGGQQTRLAQRSIRPRAEAGLVVEIFR
jgi:hypothetical protein